MGQQQGQALLHPTGHPAILTAPEQAVVHKDGVGLTGHGRFDQSQAGGHARNDALHTGPAFDLQAVGAVVLELPGLQQGVKSAQQLGARDPGGRAHRLIHARVPMQLCSRLIIRAARSRRADARRLARRAAKPAAYG